MTARRAAGRWWLLFALAVTAVLLLAALGGRFPSSAPDGLERVAADQGIDEHVADHALSDSPVAGYSVDVVDDDRLATAAAGVLGVAATLAVATGVGVLLPRAGRSRRRRATLGPGSSSAP